MRCTAITGGEVTTDEWQEAGHVFPGDLYPSRIMTFLSNRLPDENGLVPQGALVYAVIQTCKVSDHKSDSILTEQWHLETSTRLVDVHGERELKRVPLYRMVDVGALDERVFVFEENRIIPDRFYNGENPPVAHLIHFRETHWAEIWTKIDWSQILP